MNSRVKVKINKRKQWHSKTGSMSTYITDARTRGPGELGLNRWGSKAGELAESTFVKIGF